MIDDNDQVVGYYTLSPGSISPEIIPTLRRDKISQHRPTPIILLGRLAVDSRLKGQGLGKDLLLDSLKRAQEIADQVGGYAVCLDVDEGNPEAKGFYQIFDFQELLDNPMHLFLPMKTVRELKLGELNAEP
jgi:GNAT superfamily N-acetyltransferase